MGRTVVLLLTFSFTLCSAEFTFPTTSQIRPFTLEESRYMVDKVNEYRSNVSKIAGDLAHMHYNYEDEKTAAECTQDFIHHWCRYDMHPAAHNHDSRVVKFILPKFPTLESVMESFAEQAGLFDVYTGKPDDTWNELFYSVMVSSYPDTMACGMKIDIPNQEVVIHCLFANTLDSHHAIPLRAAYTPSQEPCGLCPGIPCVNNLCKPDVRWLARGLGSAYDATLAREIEEAALNESVSIYHCLAAPVISLGLTLFF